MIKFSILKWLYKHSPINFYTVSENSTIIKSINNTSLGYKYNKVFSDTEINEFWDLIKKQKRFSIIVMFLSYIFILYGLIFPNYYFLTSLKWYYSVFPLLFVVFGLYHLILFLNTKYFQKKIVEKFGEYECVVFKSSETIDLKYYNLFKFELLKVFSLILIICVCLGIGSPFKLVSKCIDRKEYNTAVRIATIGSKIFPIAPKWYSLRAYSKYQLKDYEEAIKDYDRAYKLEPDEYRVMNFDNKIYIKYHIKDYKSALKDFDYEIKNAQNDEDKDSFYWDKAQFLYNIKKYKDALEIYNYLIEKADSDRVYLLKNRLYFERAQVYQQLGQNDLAQEDFANADDLSIEESFKNPIPEPVLLLDEM